MAFLCQKSSMQAQGDWLLRYCCHDLALEPSRAHHGRSSSPTHMRSGRAPRSAVSPLGMDPGCDRYCFCFPAVYVNVMPAGLADEPYCFWRLLLLDQKLLCVFTLLQARSALAACPGHK